MWCRLIGRPVQPGMFYRPPALEAKRLQRLWWLGWWRPSLRGQSRRTKVSHAVRKTSPPFML